ncbi:partner and localizer of BRCA2 [Centropristis striata]|uniref:partner and localizer of BRCA2 n=1 Tax=Centropristis striata TaxID=184440 RepID=UPI0027E1092C|nr:partner and localizer of BRCA2 [Centropristis striata]XP_059189701.1 partner and localizer of BRCA2 [Centropristis striata]
MDTPAVPLAGKLDAEQCGGMNCEELLRTTLHCDDKEKLRRKLALLQREYLRTAERLQRAERLDVVRRHVKSRINQQNHQDQRDKEVTSVPRLNPSSLILNTNNGTETRAHTGGTADSNNPRRSQVIKFLLPSDAACPQTPDPSHDAARGHRASPALRLRSRRSRLRWERRSAEAGRSTDDNSEEGPEQSERMETVRTEGVEERVKTKETEVVNGSEELFSATDSEFPSLLLTHWNTCEQMETEDKKEKEIQGQQEQREKETELRAEGKKESESASLLKHVIHTEGRDQDGTPNERRKDTEGGVEDEHSEGQRDGRLCEDSSNKETEQDAAAKIESEKSHNTTAEIKEEKSETSLLDSCTLVEGLLFPAEYYVRTTRRMTFSQSQPDMQAVILSQLSIGRPRRSRGRGSNRHTVTGSPSSADPRMESQSAELNSQSSSEISEQISGCQIDTEACFSPKITPARPARGGRKKRGRRRPQTPRCTPSLGTHPLGLEQCSDNLSSQFSTSPSLRGADEPKLCLAPGEAAVPVQDDPQPAFIQSTVTPPSSGVSGAPSGSASEHLEKVFPIFLKGSNRTGRTSQMSRSAESWRSLLLPSSPPAQTSLPPLSSLFPGPVGNNLMNFDMTLDFHLPDDQFASLKLQKLRQVAVGSGVEHFVSPAYNTRRSYWQSDAHLSSSDAVMSLPLSLTATIPSSPHPTEAQQAAAQNLSIEHDLIDKLTRTGESSERDVTENPGEQQTENPHPESRTHATLAESMSVDQICAADCVDQYKEQDTVTLSMDHPVESQPHINFADKPAGEVNDNIIGRSKELQLEEPSVILSEEQTDCPAVVHPLENQKSRNTQTEDRAIIETLSFDCPLQKTPEEPSNSCTPVQLCNDGEASPVQHVGVNSPAKDSKEYPEPSPPRDRPVDDKNQKCSPHRRVHSQLLLSPPLASAPFITPHLPSVLLSSPTMPSLGLTPHPVHAALTSSPSAPSLTLPPPHSPSTLALSPPPLSPCPSLPPSQPPTSPAGQFQTSSEQLRKDDDSQRVEPPTCPTVSSNQSQGSGGQVHLRTEEAAEEHVIRCKHTLKAPAGGCLVDACCLLGSSGSLCVAAAGKWAVCLWSQTSAADWRLTHTWAFNEAVINVFPVPDASGLMCVTLGQLEIREVRMLSCSSLSQTLLCEGVVQAVLCVSQSRVVTSAHSASGSTLQVFTLSDSGSASSSQPLVSPGVCVGLLAPVDGLSDALIGSDDGGRLFIWNLKTGQLLQRIILGDGLSHTACVRGYSYCGVLFVLLQHQLLSSLEEEVKEVTAKEEAKEEERKKTALFSLVAINPRSGKSVLATQLYPPKAWSGRLCEADVSGSSVVGLSQSGCACVWELGRRGASGMVWAPESEGWQLARWGGGGTLVTGHHNGDVSLHC